MRIKEESITVETVEQKDLWTGRRKMHTQIFVTQIFDTHSPRVVSSDCCVVQSLLCIRALLLDYC